MLKLTTTEPFSVVCESLCENNPPHLPLVPKIGIFKNSAGSWSGYIHGKAEDEAGFDIPSFFDGELLPGTIEQEAELHLPNEIIPCLVIQWETDNEVWKHRALICAKDDTESLVYARECAAKRKSWL